MHVLAPAARAVHRCRLVYHSPLFSRCVFSSLDAREPSDSTPPSPAPPNEQPVVSSARFPSKGTRAREHDERDSHEAESHAAPRIPFLQNEDALLTPENFKKKRRSERRKAKADAMAGRTSIPDEKMLERQSSLLGDLANGLKPDATKATKKPRKRLPAVTALNGPTPKGIKAAVERRMAVERKRQLTPDAVIQSLLALGQWKGEELQDIKKLLHSSSESRRQSEPPTKSRPSRPPRSPDQIDRSPPPHEVDPIDYSRRIEGLLTSGPEKTTVLEDVETPFERPPIAKLAHGLDRVLFNPGVHWTQDPRSRVYNFSPWLLRIPDVKSFAFERLPGFIKSSHDEDLGKVAQQENRRFAGSTSSLSGLIAQIYFLISSDRQVDLNSLSGAFRNEPATFSPGQRRPTSVLMNYRDGRYFVDSDSSNPEDDEKNILMWMGTVLEKFLTHPEQEFRQLLRSTPVPEMQPEPKREAYRYSKSKKFVMRSQLDCYDPRLPGTGVFDIKTRAALPIRMDMLSYAANAGYQIRTLTGALESFEREYYDLVRSAFLKFSFQVRIGNMDGVFVAYHNTARMFGFQYIPLEEMEAALYGHRERGDRVFEKSIGLLEEIVEEITTVFPAQSVHVTAETRENTGVMTLIIQPAEWNESQGPRPIEQLNVTTSSFIGGVEVRGSRAVAAHGEPWTLRWSIARMNFPSRTIHATLQSIKSRQIFPYPIPDGVTMEQLAEIWRQIDWKSAVQPTSSSEKVGGIPGEVDTLNPKSSPARSDDQEEDLTVIPNEDWSVSSPLPALRVADTKILRLRALAAQGLADSRALHNAEREHGIAVWQQEPFDAVLYDDSHDGSTSYTIPSAESETTVADELRASSNATAGDAIAVDVADVIDASAETASSDAAKQPSS